MTGLAITHYFDTEANGVGNMGELYRTTHNELKPGVALEILPKLLSTYDPWVASLVRNAKIPDSLVHPNIAVIHGVEKSGGIRSVVPKGKEC